MKEDKANKSGRSSSNSTESRELLQQHQNRERQRRYRQNALLNPDGLLLTRLQVMLSSHADGCLSRICKATGKTKREVVEQALIELERRYSVTD